MWIMFVIVLTFPVLMSISFNEKSNFFNQSILFIGDNCTLSLVNWRKNSCFCLYAEAFIIAGSDILPWTNALPSFSLFFWWWLRTFFGLITSICYFLAHFALIDKHIHSYTCSIFPKDVWSDHNFWLEAIGDPELSVLKRRSQHSCWITESYGCL